MKLLGEDMIFFMLSLMPYRLAGALLASEKNRVNIQKEKGKEVLVGVLYQGFRIL